MTTQIFSSTDSAANAKAAHKAFLASPNQTATIMYDGAGRYAVGLLGEMEEDIDAFMAPDSWEWIEMERAEGHIPHHHGETEEEHECCATCCAAGRSLPGHSRCTPQETCGLWQPDYVGGYRPQDL